MAQIAGTGDIAFGIHVVGDDVIVNYATIIGSNTVFAESRGHARVQDIAVGECGTTILVTGSPNVFTESRQACRLGDIGICQLSGQIDTIITATGTVFAQ